MWPGFIYFVLSRPGFIWIYSSSLVTCKHQKPGGDLKLTLNLRTLLSIQNGNRTMILNWLQNDHVNCTQLSKYPYNFPLRVNKAEGPAYKQVQECLSLSAPCSLLCLLSPFFTRCFFLCAFIFKIIGSFTRGINNLLIAFQCIGDYGRDYSGIVFWLNVLLYFTDFTVLV